MTAEYRLSCDAPDCTRGIIYWRELEAREYAELRGWDLHSGRGTWCGTHAPMRTTPGPQTADHGIDDDDDYDDYDGCTCAIAMPPCGYCTQETS